jgi:hypothetical protein
MSNDTEESNLYRNQLGFSNQEMANKLPSNLNEGQNSKDGLTNIKENDDL